MIDIYFYTNSVMVFLSDLLHSLAVHSIFCSLVLQEASYYPNRISRRLRRNATTWVSLTDITSFFNLLSDFWLSSINLIQNFKIVDILFTNCYSSGHYVDSRFSRSN